LAGCLASQEDAEMEELAPEAPAEDEAALAAAAPEAAGTDQWVQCERCRTWRIVPDADWPAVEEDPRDSWFCEYATWDVATMTPFSPPCMSGKPK
jgi:CW-type Zinc Finger